MAGRKHCKDIRSNPRSPNLIGSNLGDGDDPNDVMETRLTIDYNKQWLNCVSAIGPKAAPFFCATFCSKKVHEDKIFGGHNILQFFSEVSKDYKYVKLPKAIKAL